jgi:hypothetical protein
MRVVRASALLAALTVALAVPLAVLAGGGAKRQAPPSFALGRTGGSIRPFTVKVAGNGLLAATGPVQPSAAGPLSLPLRNGLARLARAEGFFSLPKTIACPGVNPDVAGRFVTFTAAGKTRTVTERGSCTQAFDELYAVLAAVVGVDA